MDTKPVGAGFHGGMAEDVIAPRSFSQSVRGIDNLFLELAMKTANDWLGPPAIRIRGSRRKIG